MVSRRMWVSNPWKFLKNAIQNGRHETTWVITFSLIFEIEIRFSHQTICFQGINTWVLYSTLLSCKFKMAAMKSLMVSFIFLNIRDDDFIFHQTICSRYRGIQWRTLYGHRYHATFQIAAMKSSKVIILWSIIEIEASFCSPNYMFWYVGIQKTHNTFSCHHYHDWNVMVTLVYIILKLYSNDGYMSLAVHPLM